MKPLLVILLLVLVEFVVSGSHTSKEYFSEKKYRERTSTNSRLNDDSPEEVVKSKSNRVGGKSTKSKIKPDSPEEYVSKSKNRNGGKSSSKSTKSKDRSEEYFSKSKFKDGPNPKNDDLPKGSEKDLKPPGKGDSPVNTEQVGIQCFNCIIWHKI